MTDDSGNRRQRGVRSFLQQWLQRASAQFWGVVALEIGALILVIVLLSR